ncbi:nucleotidyltransferase [Sporocytophaga myxococcoides]|uniref:Nucleotidyltransferase n=1 Tax=Sporocytophaga myxococcoides TaxID=153721 RepID=A0A098LD19_9BACT|nr:nucleotidyltransferase [Sporocytophaga myxococcoides]
MECISGSRAYGLDLPTSDTDIKGVFALSKKDFYGLTYTDQVNNETNDTVFYELKRFIELLVKNNPNLLDLLSSPEDCILFKDPLMNLIKPEMFLSRLCKTTFGEYAMTQIKKAKGLNKKISNPIEKERKSVLDFCFVAKDQGAISLKDWLVEKGYDQSKCGLVKVAHMNDIYALFYDLDNVFKFNGVIHKESANEVVLSSVPKGIQPEGILSFNRNGYSVYCKEYKEYWDWVDKRNNERYENTVAHGKNYDAKNMMHVFRLLDMAEEIALYKRVIVRRQNREHLLSIRKGNFMYEDLVKQAEEKIDRIHEIYEKSDLPDAPDLNRAENLLVAMRESLYS